MKGRPVLYRLCLLCLLVYKTHELVYKSLLFITLQFISAGVHGIFSLVFCDFGNEFEVLDATGEEPKECFVGSITKVGKPCFVNFAITSYKHANNKKCTYETKILLTANNKKDGCGGHRSSQVNYCGSRCKHSLLISTHCWSNSGYSTCHELLISGAEIPRMFTPCLPPR